MLKTFFWTTFFSVCVIIFESTILTNISFLPVTPDLLLIFIIFISIHNRVILSEVSGFTSGLIFDFLTAAPLGLHALMRTIIAYVASTVKEYVLITRIIVPMLFVLVATVLKMIMLLILSFLYPGSVFSYSMFSGVFITELILNTVLAPLLFAFFSLFSPLICEEKFKGGFTDGI